MTTSKSGNVTKGITQLATNILLVLVIKSSFSLLPLGRYLLPFTTWNGYEPKDSSGNFLFTTESRNVSIVRYRVSQVTILFLDLIMIHWICWIQRKSFRKNSNSPWVFWSSHGCQSKAFSIKGQKLNFEKKMCVIWSWWKIWLFLSIRSNN